MIKKKFELQILFIISGMSWNFTGLKSKYMKFQVKNNISQA